MRGVGCVDNEFDSIYGHSGGGIYDTIQAEHRTRESSTREMTRGDGNNIRGDSKYGGGKHGGRTICRINMGDIYKHSNNEYDRVSAIYIYTNGTYRDRARDECKYLDRGDVNRGGKLRGELFSNDDAKWKSERISAAISDDRTSITISERGVIRGAVSSEYNGRAFIICDISGIRV